MNLTKCAVVAGSVGILLSCATACRPETFATSNDAQVRTAAGAAAAPSATQRVYIGTYTGPKSKGIQLIRLDNASGAISTPELAGETESPSSVAISPDGRFLYSCNETVNTDGKGAGGVSAFSLDPASGKLTFLNQQTSGGGGPCYVGLDSSGKHAFVANYGGGSFEVLPIEADGKLGTPTAFVQDKDDSGADKPRQPHGHWINIDPSGKYLLACDLGLDSVFVFRFDAAKGTVAPADPPAAATPAGAGPRHLAFSPDGHFAYVITELKSTVVVYRWDSEHGRLREIQTISSLSEKNDGSTASAEIRVHPSGKFLYASNRGSNTIAIFDVDPTTGKLTAKACASCGGKIPRGMSLDPLGHWLLVANADSDNLICFHIDAATGALTETSHAQVGAAVDVEFPPAPSR